jgi:hypothetical protein
MSQDDKSYEIIQVVQDIQNANRKIKLNSHKAAKAKIFALNATIQSIPGVNRFDGHLIYWSTSWFPMNDEIPILLYRLGLSYKNSKQCLLALQKVGVPKPKKLKQSPLSLKCYISVVREMGYCSEIHRDYLAILIHRRVQMRKKFPAYECSTGAMTDYVHRLTSIQKGGKVYENNLAYYSRIEDVYRSIVINLETSSCSISPYYLSKIKFRLVRYGPDVMIDNISKYCSDLRGAYFSNGLIPKPPTFLEGLKIKSHWKALKFSYLKRSLPSKYKTTSDPFQDFFSRQSQELYISPMETMQFRDWIRVWHNQYTLPEKARTLTSFSPKACAEKSRHAGGQDEMFRIMADYQAARCVLYPTRRIEKICLEELTKVETVTNNRVYEEISPGINKQAVINAKISIYCYFGCINILKLLVKKLGGPPIFPLLVKEKGGKERIPTMSSFAVIYLANILRAMVQPSLDRDPRIRYSQRSASYTYPRWVSNDKFGFRSLDLKTATDNHNFIFSQLFYEELLDRLKDVPPLLREVVPLITGPYRMYRLNRRLMREIKLKFRFLTYADEVLKKEFSRHPSLYKQAGLREDMSPSQEWDDMWTMSSYSHMGCPIKVEIPFEAKKFPVYELCKGNKPLNLSDEVRNFERDMILLYARLEDHGLSKRGQFMGVATSWPLLPIYNLYCWESTSDQDLILVNGVAVPQNAYLAVDTGDDFVGQCTLNHSLKFSKKLESIGSEISIGKDYWSKQGFIYCEQTVDISGEKFGPTSSLCAPRGGVHTPNWQNFVEAVKAAELVNSSDLLRHISLSRFFDELCYANYLGLPLDYPLKFGGIGLPLKVNPKSNIRRRLISKRLALSNIGEVAGLKDMKFLSYFLWDVGENPISPSLESDMGMPLSTALNLYRTPDIIKSHYEGDLRIREDGRMPIYVLSKQLLKGGNLRVSTFKNVAIRNRARARYPSLVRDTQVSISKLYEHDIPLSSEALLSLALSKERVVDPILLRKYSPVSDMKVFMNTVGWPSYSGLLEPSYTRDWWSPRWYDTLE